MGRARSAIAVRASQEALQAALIEVMNVELVETTACETFDDALDYCRPRSEELGGDAGCESWYIWTEGEWTVVGDLTMNLVTDAEAIGTLSKTLGDVVSAGADTYFEYAFFCFAANGEVRRLLILEEEELVDEGFPVKAETGRNLDDFSEEEAEHLWTSYGLPTFEYDPSSGPFHCVAVKAKD